MDCHPFDTSSSQEVIDLFTNTFSDSEGSEEGQLIGQLVEKMITTTDKDDLIGFVTTSGGSIIGCIFFSRFILPNDKLAFILSPVAIATEHQGNGIGQELINYGIAQLKSSNTNLVFTYGDPNYYSKVGFQPISEEIIKAPLILSHPEGWLAQSLDGSPINPVEGKTECIEALNDQRYW